MLGRVTERAAARVGLAVALIALLVEFWAAGAWADDAIRAGTPEAAGFSFAAVDVGIETGIFKKHGLDVERVDFAGGAKLHQAVAAGSIDVVIGTGSDLYFLIKGAPERAVAAYANDLNALSLVVRADGPIKTVADLKGKTIGTSTTGSFTSWVGRAIVARHGLREDDVKLAYLGTMNGIFAGLLSGNVDAIVGSTARSLMLEDDGKTRILANAGDEIQNFIANIIYASEPMMKERPEALRRFLAGWFETVRFMKANKAETVRITQKATHLPDAIAARGYDLEMPSFFDDGHFDRKKLAAVEAALIDVGQIDEPVPDKDLITEAFLP